MRKLILATAIAWMVTVCSAWNLFNSAPDHKTRDEVEFTRRGSMNKDDYVVTDVYPSLPCYALVENASTSLVDRAVNRYDLERDTVFVVPPAPVKRSADAHRAARGFILVLAVTNSSPPKIAFDGLSKLTSTVGDTEIELEKGTNLLSFIEIGVDQFMVESRTLTDMKNER